MGQQRLVDLALQCGCQQSATDDSTSFNFSASTLARFAQAIRTEAADTEPTDVVVAIERPEGYEDVHPELVAEDAMARSADGKFTFNWRVVAGAQESDPSRRLVDVPSDLPEFYDWVAGELLRRDPPNRANFTQGVAESLRGRAILLRHVSKGQR